MKFIALAVFLLVFSCKPERKYASYGAEIYAEETITTSSFLEKVTEQKESYKIHGVVEEVCQSKGCWMKIRNDQNQSIRVTFKDYGFFVPKDIAGREVIIEGEASKIELAEELAKHYAEDAGKESADLVTAEVSIVASGVLVSED